jgi:hypothetical protein
VVITELDEDWLKSQTLKLSALQRKLLREALGSYARRALHPVHGAFEPGSFGLKGMMSQYEEGQVRACARAAAGLSIARLVRRGLLECCSRGWWRLTETGIEVAKALHPNP